MGNKQLQALNITLWKLLMHLSKTHKLDLEQITIPPEILPIDLFHIKPNNFTIK